MLNKELFEEISSWLNERNSSVCVLIDECTYTLGYRGFTFLKNGSICLYPEPNDHINYAFGIRTCNNQLYSFDRVTTVELTNGEARRVLIQIYTQLFTPQT